MNRATIAKPCVSVVIPCFNESNQIEVTVRRLAPYLRGLAEIRSFEILLINDGSSDTTGECLDRLQRQMPEVSALHFSANRGRGAAIREGITASQGHFLCVLDADLSYDESHIPAMLDVLRQESPLGAVLVSAYMRGGVVASVPLSRRAFSKLANRILSPLFPGRLSTLTCSVRGYPGEVIRSLPLREDGKALHLEILWELFRRGYPVKEIPGRLVWKSKKRRSLGGSGSKLGKSSLEHLRYGLRMKSFSLRKAFSFGRERISHSVE